MGFVVVAVFFFLLQKHYLSCNAAIFATILLKYSQHSATFVENNKDIIIYSSKKFKDHKMKVVRIHFFQYYKENYLF